MKGRGEGKKAKGRKGSGDWRDLHPPKKVKVGAHDKVGPHLKHFVRQIIKTTENHYN